MTHHAGPASATGTSSTALDDCYHRLSAALDGVDLHSGGRRAVGFLTAADLARPGATAAVVDDRAQWLTRRYGERPRPDVAACSAMLRYLWLAGLALAGPYLTHRRAPRPTRLAVAPDLSAVGVEPAAVACLPGDPLATVSLPGGSARAVVLPDLDALRRDLRDTVAAQAAPVLDAFAPYLRRPSFRQAGRRRGIAALWAAATDQFASAVWSVGRALGEEERCVAEAQALLPGAAPPFRGGAGFRRLALGGDRSVLTRTRNGCCRYYTLAGQPPCLTCPRIDDAERRRRLDADR